MASAASNAASPLLQLPPELLVRTASFLTTPELGCLRRTCKDVESRLFESFAYEFFHKRQFMIEEPSLQALVDISNHATLSKRLSEVIISTAAYDGAGNPQSVTAQKLARDGFAVHEMLLFSGQARDMLAEAFEKLPNLRSVGLRDYDAKGRYRDGEHALWRSYTHSYAQNVHTHAPSPAWAIVLAALGAAKVTLPSLEVFLRRQPYLCDESFNVLSTRMAGRISPILSRLRTLMLTVEAHHSMSHAHLQKFLHNAPLLEHLRLNFNDSTTTLLDWLALEPKSSSAASPSSGMALNPASPLPLAHLNTLDLGMVRVEPSTLLKVLARFKLKAFNLWKIWLEVDDRSGFKDPEMENPATIFLKGLAKTSGSSVERAMLGAFKVNGKNNPRYRAYDVDFPPASQAAPSAKKFNDRRGSSAGSVSKRIDMRTRTIHFSLGGSAPDFAVWASEMAARATIKRTSGGYEIPFSDHGGDSDSDSEVVGIISDSEEVDDEEDEEGDE